MGAVLLGFAMIAALCGGGRGMGLGARLEHDTRAYAGAEAEHGENDG